MSLRLPVLLLVLLVLLAACAAPGKDAPADTDKRHLGLFVDAEEEPEGRITQVRPLYWKWEGDRGEKKVNVLGFVYRYAEDPTFRRVLIFPNMYYTERKKPQEHASWWFMFFPFLYMGHDDFLIFPLGGYSRGILGIDEIIMVSLFYIRGKRVKASPVDPVTFTAHHVLWPIFAWGSDGRPGGRRKFRVFPFYGKSRSWTGSVWSFIMWPFWTRRVREEYEYSWHLFPFVGHQETPAQESWTVLWPFYSYRHDRFTGTKHRALWPFWRRTDGRVSTPRREDDYEGMFIRRYWPVYEFRRVGFTTTEYAVWPIIRRTYLDEGPRFGKYTWVVPFYRRVHLVSRTDGSEYKKHMVWPAVRVEKYSNGKKEIAVPLWLPIDGPALRRFFEPVRPFISIYRKKTRPNGDRETTAAFGLYLRYETETTKQIRYLTGIVGWDESPEGRYLRLLWGIRLRVGD